MPIEGLWLTRSHLHCIRDPTYAQILSYFQKCISRELLSPLRSAYDRNQRWKKWRPKREAKSRILPSVFLDHFPFRPYADRSRDRRSREKILKIAQSGHGLSLRLSMGDGRSGWWAPGLTRGISHYFSCSRYQLFTVSNILISNLTIRTLDHEDDATFFPLANVRA